MARAAAAFPAKVLARRTGLTERHIRGLARGEHMPGGVALIALAQAVPELRSAVVRWLGVDSAPIIDAAEEAAIIAAAIRAHRQKQGDHG